MGIDIGSCTSKGVITEDGTVDFDDAVQLVAEWLACNLLYDEDCL